MSVKLRKLVRARDRGELGDLRMYCVLDAVRIYGVDLEEIEALRLKERIAAHVWSRTVTYQQMTDLHPEEQSFAREHFGRWGIRGIREPGESLRRERRVLNGSLRTVPLSINLISHDNGVGLTTDARLLRTLFESLGHDVRYCEWRGGSGTADVNVYLELFDPQHLASARAHIGLFNLEWFDARQVSSLGAMTQLWAKSTEALRVYEDHGNGLWPAYYTGFASRDMRRDLAVGIPKVRHCLHVRGKASQKGTDVVLECWRRHGDRLPPLTVTAAGEFDGCAQHRNHPRVTIDIGYKSEDDLAAVMTRHRFHVCPSETEGWGHYITEALSTEAAVITTDASPMHEHVKPDFGILLPVAHVPQGLVTRYKTDPDVLAEAVLKLAAKDDRDLDEMGRKARAHWEARQKDFAEKATALIARL